MEKVRVLNEVLLRRTVTLPAAIQGVHFRYLTYWTEDGRTPVEGLPQLLEEPTAGAWDDPEVSSLLGDVVTALVSEATATRNSLQATIVGLEGDLLAHQTLVASLESRLAEALASIEACRAEKEAAINLAVDARSIYMDQQAVIQHLAGTG